MAKFMNLPDGPGWSPDGGQFWVKGDSLYWHDGDVTDLSAGCALRTMPGGYQHDDNYSLWTDEERALIKAESDKRYAVKLQEEQVREANRDSLRSSAKSKLTADEIEACDLC